MFQDRKDAATQLVARLKHRKMIDPIVLGIPRGGVIPAAIIARGIDADMDVLLARKLRAAVQPELAIGAISEKGEVYLYHPDMVNADYLEEEKLRQIAEIRKRRILIEQVVKPASLRDRTVIITDDGIATGSTLMAGLHAVRGQQPNEIIVAVPVAPPDTLKRIKEECDEVICLHSPKSFWSVGQFYRSFDQVSDDEMIEIIRDFCNNTRHSA